MATRTEFSWTHFLNRLLMALVLVFVTYNPEGWSYYHWAIQGLPPFSVEKAFAGVVLLIGWSMFVRATLLSLGGFGIVLAIAFFGTLFWMLVDRGWVPVNNLRAISYLVLLAVSGVLAAGVSWSHLRRRLSGQADVDDVEQ